MFLPFYFDQYRLTRERISRQQGIIEKLTQERNDALAALEQDRAAFEVDRRGYLEAAEELEQRVRTLERCVSIACCSIVGFIGPVLFIPYHARFLNSLCSSFQCPFFPQVSTLEDEKSTREDKLKKKNQSLRALRAETDELRAARERVQAQHAFEVSQLRDHHDAALRDTTDMWRKRLGVETSSLIAAVSAAEAEAGALRTRCQEAEAARDALSGRDSDIQARFDAAQRMQSEGEQSLQLAMRTHSQALEREQAAEQALERAEQSVMQSSIRASELVDREQAMATRDQEMAAREQALREKEDRVEALLQEAAAKVEEARTLRDTEAEAAAAKVCDKQQVKLPASVRMRRRSFESSCICHIVSLECRMPG